MNKRRKLVQQNKRPDVIAGTDSQQMYHISLLGKNFGQPQHASIIHQPIQLTFVGACPVIADMRRHSHTKPIALNPNRSIVARFFSNSSMPCWEMTPKMRFLSTWISRVKSSLYRRTGIHVAVWFLCSAEFCLLRLKKSEEEPWQPTKSFHR